ncbi:MAG TPA: sigma-70 family RNA polymerase sigma factor [Candidatus Elarobacter sp.]|jgi:RNA polymerase sigma factor for flagellar operon FliA|nr:sigma-70 family RNA polymerase sigma factor [Candidatus Elarobacter sp.]
MSADEREARIRSLLPMVRAIARRVHRMVPVADVDDLIGDGCVGLIRAVDAFDPARGVPIENYARRVILGAVLNGIRRMDPVSERMRRTMRDASVARYRTAQETGTMPGFAELERRSPAIAAARAQVHRRTPLSLDATLPNDEKLDVDRSNDPQAIVAAKLERERIRAAIDALAPRQRRIVVAHYFGEKRLRELVEPLGVSPQRVSQLHLGALERLRAALAATA